MWSVCVIVCQHQYGVYGVVIVCHKQCGAYVLLCANINMECTGLLFCQNQRGMYVLLCAKISVNYNGFCVSTSGFATLILSIVKKEDVVVSACLCVRVFHPTLKICSTRCAFFSRGVEFET